MKYSIQNMLDLYRNALNNTDQRVKDYPLLWNDPIPVIGLVIFYLLFVLIGKRVMKNLPAVNVPSYILFAYNFFLVFLSLYMFEEIVVGVMQSGYSLTCAEVKVSNSKEEMKVTNALWLYFFSKAIELLDTFWMVIRKRFNQITFLHVFHHSTMLLIWWVVASWTPGGQSWFGAALNCLVHVFMYSYYGLSLIPSLKDKLWWKKYITTFQLIQFICIFVHAVIGLRQTVYGTCKFPIWGQVLLISYMFIMFALFSNFYMQEYIKKSNERKKRKERDINNNLILDNNSSKKSTKFYSSEQRQVPKKLN